MAVTLSLAASDDNRAFLASGGDTARFSLDPAKGPYTMENEDPESVSAQISDNVLILTGLQHTLSAVDITVTAADGEYLPFQVSVDTGWPDYYYVEDPLIAAYKTLVGAYAYTYADPPDDIRAIQTLLDVINEFSYDQLWTLSNGMLKVGEAIYCLPIPKISSRNDPAGAFYIYSEYSGYTLRVDPIDPGASNFNAWVVDETEQIQISCSIY